jgi:hypothetical protein
MLLLAGCDARAPEAAADEPASAPATAPTRSATSDDAAPMDDEAGFPTLDDTVVAATDTLATLQSRHGAANAVAAKVPGAEGAEFDGWVLFPGDPMRRAYVYVDEGVTTPSMVSVFDRESLWRRTDGIRMGLALDELARRNGKPVRFMGFDWDYGGGITNWNGGTFDRKPAVGPVQLCLPEVDAPDDGVPVGDTEFDSTHAWVVAHPPTVCSFSVRFDAPTPPSPSP